MRKIFVMYTFLFFSILSCTSDKDKELSTDNSLSVDTNSANMKLDTISIDSTYLIDLEIAYMNGGVLWGDEAESYPPQGSEGMYCIVSHKLKFNSDSIKDYFLTEYESRFAYSYIIDGRTGRKIPFTDNSLQPIDIHSMFWHRPSDSGIVAKVVDVSCSDNREELMIIYTFSNISFGSYLLLYRYNEQTDEVDLIFNDTICEEIVTNKVIRDTLNYIDILFSTPDCITDINIQPGMSVKPINHQLNYLNIKPLQNAKSTTYIFNDEKNLFVLKN